MSKTYKDLIVWQKSMELVQEVYKKTSHFPDGEKYGLTSQMRCAAVSIPSNIAEGKLQGSQKQFKNSLLIAYGSGGELETQVMIAKDLPFGKNTDFSEVDSLLGEVMKMRNSLISKADNSETSAESLKPNYLICPK